MSTSHVEQRPRFGTLLRRFRLAAGLSQEVLAERAAMSANGISALERGASRAPQRETLTLLVEALQLTPEQTVTLEQAAVRPSRPRNVGLQREFRHCGLPRALTPFYGRERDIDALMTLVERTQLITLTGSGGVGKTRLALEVAKALSDAFPDGIRFVDLAPMRDQDTVAAAVAAHFDVKPSGIPLLEQLISSLEHKRALLIIDNCEHLIDAVAYVSQALIAACPELCIIATSRQSLNVPGEHLYRVSSLDRENAVKLFVDRAKRAFWSFTASEEDLEMIARIVQRLDGIALAIELAAARITVLTPHQIEARLSERFHVLSGGSSLMLPRHQTMRTALEWSYHLLSSDEQKVFRRLWIFPDSFSMDAVVAVCRENHVLDESRVFDILTSLVDKSLVVSFPFEKVQRYRLLETMRAYAGELLQDSDEIERLQRMHAEYYALLAERMERALGSAESTTAWARSLEPETENFRSALDWMLAGEGDVIIGAEMLCQLQEFWTSQGLTMEASRRAQAALDRDPEMPHAARASLWLTVARMHQGLWVHPQATLEAARRAREHYEHADDPSGLALAIRQEGAAQMRLAAYPEARENFERSIALYRDLGDQRMVVRGLGYLASLFQVQQDYALARATLLDVLEAVKESGDDRMIPTVVMNLAETEFALGECESASQRARKNLAHVEMIKSIEMRATQKANLSAYLFALGKTGEAREMALQSAHDAINSFVAVPLQHLAAIGAATNPKWAATLLGYVEAVFETTGFTREYTELYTYDRLVATLNEHLDESELTECLREGAAMSEKQARRTAASDS